jgi:hypothetical protein
MSICLHQCCGMYHTGNLFTHTHMHSYFNMSDMAPKTASLILGSGKFVAHGVLQTVARTHRFT